jgi:hypothetical protein
MIALPPFAAAPLEYGAAPPLAGPSLRNSKGRLQDEIVRIEQLVTRGTISYERLMGLRATALVERLREEHRSFLGELHLARREATRRLSSLPEAS